MPRYVIRGGVHYGTIDDLVASVDALSAARDAEEARAEQAEARSYALAVAIMGGEDATGLADATPVEYLADLLRKERLSHCDWVDAAAKAARADGYARGMRDTATLIAIEAENFPDAVTWAVEYLGKAILAQIIAEAGKGAGNGEAN
jgi:hypothetical protein